VWAGEQEREADQSRPQVHKTPPGIAVAASWPRYRDEVVTTQAQLPTDIVVALGPIADRSLSAQTRGRQSSRISARTL
jgi:hypothetical protein